MSWFFRYLKKDIQSTLEEKIAAVRKAKNTAKDIEIEMKKDDNDEVEQLGGKEAKGQFFIKISTFSRDC